MLHEEELGGGHRKCLGRVDALRATQAAESLNLDPIWSAIEALAVL